MSTKDEDEDDDDAIELELELEADDDEDEDEDRDRHGTPPAVGDAEAEKQYFTVDEATETLATLRELFGRVMQLRAQLKTLYHRLENAGHPPREEHLRGTTPGGSRGERLPADVQHDLVLFRGLVETLRDQVDAIQATGCIIKDIEIGLVDWLSRHDGREILLCWKYGELEIGWWHEVDSGFAGRRPVGELDD